MAYDNSINVGAPPLLWSEVNEAFQQINENFTIIGSSLGRSIAFNIAHIELSNPVRVVTTTEQISVVSGQQVFIDTTGISQLDGNTYYAKRISNDEIELYADVTLINGVNGSTFDSYASGGGTVQGLTDFTGLDFESFQSNIIPNETGLLNLGSPTNRWGQIHLEEAPLEIESSENNGLWLGSAQLKGINGIVELPPNSTVAGELIIDPNKTFFKSVEIDNGNRIEADEFIDTLNLISGTAIQLSTDSAAESITIDNTGVTGLVSGSGISVSSATGNITVGNTGVLSVTNASTLPSGRSAGAGIAVDTSTGDITLTNTGILSVEGGFGITVNIDTATGIANVVNTAPAQVAFRNILVDGQNTIVADSTADDLTFAEGYGIILTTDDATDTVTIAVDQTIDITGSVFANDSTLLVDGVDGVIVGPINTTGILDGELIGSVFADDSTLLVDGVAGRIAGIIENTSIFTNTITGRSDLTLVGANGDTDGGTVVVVGGIGNGGDGGDITLAAGIGSAGVGGEVTIAGGIGSTDGGEVTITGGIGSAGEGGPVSISGGSGGTDGGDVTIYAGVGGTSNGVINIGTFNTFAVNIANATITGDLTGSVFADNSARLIDGVAGIIHAEYIQGTATIDIKGSVFGDDSSVIIDGATGTVTGKIAPNADTPGSEFAAGESGEIRVDDDYIWVKTPTTGAWKKVALTSFGS